MPSPAPSRRGPLLAVVAGACLLLASAGVAAQSQEQKPTGAAATPIATQPRPAATATEPAGIAPTAIAGAAATPVSAATPTEPSGVDGNHYASPHFGVGLTWDPHVWQVQGERAVPNFDGLQLGTADSSVFVEGIRDYAGDPTVCLADMQMQLTDRANRNSVETSRDKPSPLSDPSGAESSLSVFEVSQAGGAPLRVVEWTQCRTLVPEDSVLVLSWDVPEDAFAREFPKVVELLNSLEMPGVAVAPVGHAASVLVTLGPFRTTSASGVSAAP